MHRTYRSSCKVIKYAQSKWKFEMAHQCFVKFSKISWKSVEHSLDCFTYKQTDDWVHLGETLWGWKHA
jgi:hypothetical protein